MRRRDARAGAGEPPTPIGAAGLRSRAVGDPQRLSSPLSEIRDHYRVVVVGSGYGASIAASRLARAGQSVCLLERGRELHPGEYPRSTEVAAEHLQLDAADGQTMTPGPSWGQAGQPIAASAGKRSWRL